MASAGCLALRAAQPADQADIGRQSLRLIHPRGLSAAPLGVIMRLEEIFEKNYAPKVSVHLDGVKDNDREEIEGMLRGLVCAIEG